MAAGSGGASAEALEGTAMARDFSLMLVSDGGRPGGAESCPGGTQPEPCLGAETAGGSTAGPALDVWPEACVQLS